MPLQATGLYDFPGAGAGQLPFKKGDKLVVTTSKDPLWLSAQLAHLPSIIGIVPANYVKVEAHAQSAPPLPPPPSPPQAQPREALAMYNFSNGPAGHLPFLKGDVLQVQAGAADDDWLKATLGNRSGIIPKNYIKFTKVQPLSHENCLQQSLFSDPPVAASAPSPPSASPPSNENDETDLFKEQMKQVLRAYYLKVDLGKAGDERNLEAIARAHTDKPDALWAALEAKYGVKVNFNEFVEALAPASSSSGEYLEDSHAPAGEQHDTS